LPFRCVCWHRKSTVKIARRTLRKLRRNCDGQPGASLLRNNAQRASSLNPNEATSLRNQTEAARRQQRSKYGRFYYCSMETNPSRLAAHVTRMPATAEGTGTRRTTNFVSNALPRINAQDSRTCSEAFLVAAQTGHVSTAASHARHRHRCRHGSSSTHASAPRHDLHDAAPPFPLDAASTPSAKPAKAVSVSKQQDCASSASPSTRAPVAGC
jgi:hypothetical protein